METGWLVTLNHYSITQLAHTSISFCQTYDNAMSLMDQEVVGRRTLI